MPNSNAKRINSKYLAQSKLNILSLQCSHVPKKNEPFHSCAGACDAKVRGALTQDNKVLAAHSTTLNEAQKKCLVAEKESLATDKCCQVFSNMMKGEVIVAHADHVSLMHGPATNHTSQRVARQMIRIIEDYDIKKFKHIAESKNT